MVAKRLVRYGALPMLAALLLSGCGGGSAPGGSVSAPSPAPTPTASATAEQREASRSNFAVAANADSAYRMGVTGRGIKIAVLDTGIMPGLSEFAGRIDPASADIGGSRGLGDVSGHGTAITSIAAAARDGSAIHGIAFDATILSFNVTDPARCSGNDCPAQSGPVVRAIDAAIASGARVINMSFNVDQTADDLTDAVRRAAAAGIVIVISAGNESASQPLLLSRSFVEAGGGNVIIAGGVDSLGRRYRHGNQAGSGPAAMAYLNALGVDVNMIDRDGSVIVQSGTSASAPVISGAAALIAQARPNLTGRQIVALLLDNATDAGAAGPDAVFGRGILNIGAALSASNGS